MCTYKKINIVDAPRTELHDALELTGCEVSINELLAGGAVPFVHEHKANEELYGILDGKGELYIDGEVVPLVAGDWFRIDPAGHRAIRAAADCGIKYLCIQTKRGSLEAFTANDGALCPDKTPWHK